MLREIYCELDRLQLNEDGNGEDDGSSSSDSEDE